MKKSEMNGIQKANYEYMRSLGIKKSWAKRLVSGRYSSEQVDTESLTEIVIGFAFWSTTKEGYNYWYRVCNNTRILKSSPYSRNMLKIMENLAKDAE